MDLFWENWNMYIMNHSDQLTESLMLLAIAIVLLLIAAIIEANFTIAWYQYIKGSI